MVQCLVWLVFTVDIVSLGWRTKRFITNPTSLTVFFTNCYISIISAFKFLFDADEFEISLPYDSKTMTGFVGLINNQGGEKAYASALIQMMFHIPCFWKAILEIPETIPVKSLFLCLESSKTTVSLESLGITSNTLKKGLLEVFATVSEKMKVSYFLRNIIVHTVDALM